MQINKQLLEEMIDKSLDKMEMAFEDREEKPAGEDLEEGIVAVWNRKPFPPLKQPVSKEGCVNIVKFVQAKGVKGKAEQLGRGVYEVTPQWAKYFEGNVPPTTKTPKTDIKIGGNKISLKGGPFSQLMSGGRSESMATFYAALKSVDNLAPTATKKIEEMFKSLAPSSVAASDLKSEIEKGKDKMVMKANAAHKALMGELGKFFDSNRTFANAFAFEAMSGATKFGGNDGTCNTVLASSWDGKQNHLEILKPSSKFVSAVADNMKLSVRFKTTSVKSKGVKTGQYRYWSVIGLIINSVEKMHENFLKENVELTEGNVVDFFKKVGNWLMNVFQKIANWLSESFKHILEFFEVEPVIGLNNNIDFLSL